jgi:hypothetical protein
VQGIASERTSQPVRTRRRQGIHAPTYGLPIACCESAKAMQPGLASAWIAVALEQPRLWGSLLLWSWQSAEQWPRPKRDDGYQCARSRAGLCGGAGRSNCARCRPASHELRRWSKGRDPSRVHSLNGRAVVSVVGSRELMGAGIALVTDLDRVAVKCRAAFVSCFDRNVDKRC